jgi:hypothetical protein
MDDKRVSRRLRKARQPLCNSKTSRPVLRQSLCNPRPQHLHKRCVYTPSDTCNLPVFLHCRFLNDYRAKRVDQVFNQLQSIVELVSYKWTSIRRRKFHLILCFPDTDELQAIPRLTDNCTRLTEPPHGSCAPAQCEGFRYGLGAPATAK